MDLLGFRPEFTLFLVEGHRGTDPFSDGLFNLANSQEALGLPEGSVLAIIALSLIVLFAILTIYLYADVSRPNCSKVRSSLPLSVTASSRTFRPGT